MLKIKTIDFVRQNKLFVLVAERPFAIVHILLTYTVGSGIPNLPCIRCCSVLLINNLDSDLYGSSFLSSCLFC